MEELINFLLSRMSDEELEDLYYELVGDTEELYDENEPDCENCKLRDDCDAYHLYNLDDTCDNDSEDNDDTCDYDCETCKYRDECIEDEYDDDCDCDNEDVNCDGECDNCELEDEFFKSFCDIHDDCFDCDYFDFCFKETYGHKYTIADRIDRVKFSGPATIVFWLDGTKTVSVCSDEDIYDPEKGLAMCMLKKLLGNSDYNEVFKRFIPDSVYEEEPNETDTAVADAYNVVEELLDTKKLTDRQRDAIKLLLDID